MSESCSTIPPRKSHARVKSGEDMMDVLAHDIMRYEMLSEQDEYKALASVRQVRASFPVSLAMSRQCKYRYFCNSISELCSSISVRQQIKTIK